MNLGFYRDAMAGKLNLGAVCGAAVELLHQITAARATALFVLDQTGSLNPIAQAGQFEFGLDEIMLSFGRNVVTRKGIVTGYEQLQEEKTGDVVFLLGHPVAFTPHKKGVIVVAGDDWSEFNRPAKKVVRRVARYLDKIACCFSLEDFCIGGKAKSQLSKTCAVAEKQNLSLEGLLDIIAELLAMVVYYDTCLLLLFEENKERVQVRTLRNNLPGLEFEQEYLTDGNLVPAAFFVRQAVLVGNLSKDQRFAGCFLQDKLHSLMLVPITNGSSPLGVLLVGAQGVNAFKREDLKILQNFITQIGTLYQLAASYTLWQNYQQDIIANIPIAVVSINLQGYVTIFNRQAQWLTGLSPDQVVGCHFQEALATLSDLGGFDWSDIIKKAIEKCQSSVYQGLPFSNGQGYSTLINLYLAPIYDANGSCLGLNMAMEDLTRQKGLVTGLWQEEKNTALSELAAGIAHQIRNPLTTVKGFTQILQQGNCSKEEQENFTKVMLSEVRRIEEIIHGMLLLTANRSPDSKLIDLRQLLTSLLSIVKAEALLQDVEIQLEVAPDLPQVRVAPEELQQAFMNIIANALQVMPYGGVLAIAACYQEAEGKVWVSFADTGPGIRPEDYQRIFHPFFTTTDEGIGLSLAIAHRIVENYGGEITVASKLGEGTTFTVKLPVPDPQGE
ncbi:MAG: GAF domain-containing sensor histidine kinase [bacterium]|jgi:PAS domain S-box-containing protein